MPSFSLHQEPPVKCNFLQEDMNLAETFQNLSKWFGYSLLISINSKWAWASPKCLWKSLTHFSWLFKWLFGQPALEMTKFTFVSLYSDIHNVHVPNVKIFLQKDSWDVVKETGETDFCCVWIKGQSSHPKTVSCAEGCMYKFQDNTTFIVIFLSPP